MAACRRVRAHVVFEDAAALVHSLGDAPLRAQLLAHSYCQLLSVAVSCCWSPPVTISYAASCDMTYLHNAACWVFRV